ncbi:MAG: sugar nucleotide-binding protein, partial [Oligoflexia bacterium]|nr:sugar nucleotide-binding protein [Oligoflexia bacterium]
FAQETMAKLIKRIKPAFIINAAGVNDFSYCQSNPKICDDINANICRYLIGLAEVVPSRFILLSSGEVFNGVKGNFVENDKLMPTTAFGRSKKSAEILTAKYSSRSTILRISSVYGLGNARNQTYLNRICAAMLKKEPVQLISDLYRSHIYVKDLAEVIHRIMQQKPRYLVYNIGGKEKTTDYDVGLMFSRLMGVESMPVMEHQIKDPRMLALRGKDLTLNSQRFYREYNFTPRELSKGLLDSIEMMKEGR